MALPHSAMDDQVKDDVGRGISSTDKTQQPPETRRKVTVPRWLIVFDFIASRLLGVLAVAFWKATWSLIDEHVYPDDKDVYKSIGISCLLGPGLTLSAMMLQGHTLDLLTSKMNFVTKHIFLRAYMYVAAVSAVNNWRWLWYLVDELTGTGALSAGLCLAIGAPGLIITRHLINIVACPGVILLDIHDHSLLKWITFFRTEPGTWSHIGDCLFSVMVIDTLIVGAWRGTWELFNVYYLPDDPELSAIHNLVISTALGVLLLSIRIPARQFAAWCEKKAWVLLVAVEGVNTTLHFLSVVLMWRGLWLLLDDHFLDRSIRFYVLHAVGFISLSLFRATNSLLTRVGGRDGVIPDGKGVLLDMRYLSDMLRAYRKWKLRQEPGEAGVKGHRSSLASVQFSHAVTSLDLETHVFY